MKLGRISKDTQKEKERENQEDKRYARMKALSMDRERECNQSSYKLIKRVVRKNSMD